MYVCVSVYFTFYDSWFTVWCEIILLAGAVESGSQSAHRTTQYEKLAQEASDEEIEDDVIFLQEGAVLHRNGFAANNHDEIISAGKTKDDAALEGLLQKGKVSSKRPAGGDFVQVKIARWHWRRILNCRRVAVLLVVLLFSLITTLVAILVLYRSVQYVLPTPNWKKEYKNYGNCFFSVIMCTCILQTFVIMYPFLFWHCSWVTVRCTVGPIKKLTLTSSLLKFLLWRPIGDPA